MRTIKGVLAAASGLAVASCAGMPASQKGAELSAEQQTIIDITKDFRACVANGETNPAYKEYKADIRDWQRVINESIDIAYVEGYQKAVMAFMEESGYMKRLQNADSAEAYRAIEDEAYDAVVAKFGPIPDEPKVGDTPYLPLSLLDPCSNRMGAAIVEENGMSLDEFMDKTEGLLLEIGPDAMKRMTAPRMAP